MEPLEKLIDDQFKAIAATYMTWIELCDVMMEKPEDDPLYWIAKKLEFTEKKQKALNQITNQ